MTNLPLVVLFWTAIPYALYRSSRRWRTFFFCIGTWLATVIVLAILIGIFAADPERFRRAAGDAAWLVAILVAVWHSHRSRKASAAPAPPSVII